MVSPPIKQPRGLLIQDWHEWYINMKETMKNKKNTWAIYIPSNVRSGFKYQIYEDGSWFFKRWKLHKKPGQTEQNQSDWWKRDHWWSLLSRLSMAPQKFNDPRKRGTSTFGSVFPSSEVWPTMLARFQRRLHAMPCANSLKTWNSTRHMMCSTKLFPP